MPAGTLWRAAARTRTPASTRGRARPWRPRGAVVAGLENVCARVGQAGADRHAASEAFGKRHHVWCDRLVLVREPPSGAAEPCLHLVEDQQEVLRVAPLTDTSEVTRVCRDDPDLAHHGLQHHGYRAHSGRVLDRVEVVVTDLDEPLAQRLQSVPQLVCATTSLAPQ